MFDLRKVFTNPFGDKDFGKKFVIGCLIMLFPTVFSLIKEFLSKEQSRELFMHNTPVALAASVIAGFFACISIGYYFRIINNRINSNEEIMPDWQISKNFTIGLKAVAGTFLLVLPFSLLLFFGAIFIISGPVLGTLMISVISFFATIAYLICVIALCLLMNISYAQDFKFLSFFNFKRAWGYLKGNIFGFLLYIGLIAAISILTQLFSFILLLVLGIISIIAIVPLAFYTLLLNAEIAGQFVNGVNKKEITGE